NSGHTASLYEKRPHGHVCDLDLRDCTRRGRIYCRSADPTALGLSAARDDPGNAISDATVCGHCGSNLGHATAGRCYGFDQRSSILSRTGMSRKRRLPLEVYDSSLERITASAISRMERRVFMLCC